jgi:outer membrane protein
LNNILKQIDSEKEKNPETVKLFEGKREEFMQKKTAFEEENAALSQQYDQEILTQLNQYVKDYGTKNNFSLLFGNDGNGSLMYGTDDLNRTKDVLEYVNNKYNGVE